MRYLSKFFAPFWLKTWCASVLLGASALSYAAPVSLLTVDVTGPFEMGSHFSVVYAGPSGHGTLSLDLLGYGSVDGVNDFRDQFVMLLNGAPVFAGSFNMGGGGASTIDFNTLGATSTTGLNGSSGPLDVTFLGGTTQVEWLNFDLQVGDVLTLGYASVGPPYFGQQIAGDEAWGVSRLQFTQAIPEPSTTALWSLAFTALLISMHRTASRRGRAYL